MASPHFLVLASKPGTSTATTRPLIWNSLSTRAFTDLSRLRADPDLAPLLDRHDLQRVIESKNLQATPAGTR